MHKNYSLPSPVLFFEYPCGIYIYFLQIIPFRVRTKFSVVDDDAEGQLMRTRARPRKLGPNSQKSESGKEWKAFKSTSYRQNVNTSGYQIENAGHITPLPPPLVSLSL